MDAAEATVSERIAAGFEGLTPAERRLATALLDSYPVLGLASITTVADGAGVSPPTVARLVKKLGFQGFPDFQAALRAEVEATLSSPLAKHERWAAKAPAGHILNAVADAALANMRQTLAHIDIAAFDAAAALAADPGRAVHVAGGRITGALADYLFMHLHVIRPRVTLIAGAQNRWPHYVLNVEPGDVLLAFDIRRYETAMLRLVEAAAAKGAEVVLFTDQWGSPAARRARHVFHARVEAPSAWDSSLALMLLAEALVAAVQTAGWDGTRARMKALEALFEQTRPFRRPG